MIRIGGVMDKDKAKKKTEARNANTAAESSQTPRRRTSIFSSADLGFNIFVRESEILKDIESGRIPGPHGGPC
jgi:hypothetical protein